MLANKELIKGCVKELFPEEINYFLGISYPAPNNVYKEKEFRHNIFYSLGNDYHRILNNKITKLVNFIKNKTPIKSIISMDSGPLSIKQLHKEQE